MSKQTVYSKIYKICIFYSHSTLNIIVELTQQRISNITQRVKAQKGMELYECINSKNPRLCNGFKNVQLS